LNIFSGAADLGGLDLSLTQLEFFFSIQAVKPNKPASQLEINCSVNPSICREEIWELCTEASQ
jgi:hypothetical protein